MVRFADSLRLGIVVLSLAALWGAFPAIALADDAAVTQPAVAAPASAAPTAAPQGRFQVGQAEVVLPADADGKINMAKLPAALDDLYQQAVKQYGPGEPKLALLLTNIPAGIARGVTFVHAKYAKGVPLYGMGTGAYGGATGGYSPVGHAAFLDDKQPGMALVLLGGDFTFQPAVVGDAVMAVKDWDLAAEAAKTGVKEDDLRTAQEQHQEWGRQLAAQVKPVAGQTNVYLQLGTQHVPRMTWVHQGLVQAFGPAVYIVGGSRPTTGSSSTTARRRTTPCWASCSAATSASPWPARTRCPADRTPIPSARSSRPSFTSLAARRT